MKYPVNIREEELKNRVGKDDKGRMLTTCPDERYNELLVNLRSAMKVLSIKIEPKVYEYGFLME